MEECNEEGTNDIIDSNNGMVQGISEIPMVIFLQTGESQDGDVLGLPTITESTDPSASVNGISNDVALIQSFGDVGLDEGGTGIPITWLGCAGGSQDQLLYVTYMPDNSAPGEQGQPMLLQVTSGGDDVMYAEQERSGGEESEEEEEQVLEQEEQPPPQARTQQEKNAEAKRKTKAVNSSWQTIADDVHIETKLQVLEAMLPPLPRATPTQRVRPVQEGAKYACDLCGAVFSRAPQYYGHLHSHTGERTWSCEACGLVFAAHSQLRKHEKIHLNLRPHVCGLCGLQFDRESQLQYHERRIHLQERTHRCQFCLKGFFKRSDLRSHLNIHLGIRKNICETCGRQFHHRSNLVRHSRIHTGIKPYVCRECGVRFTQVNALNSHKAQHHPHLTAEGVPSFECDHCLKVLRSLALLKRHIRLMHNSDTDKPQEVHLKRRQYYCQICGESFQFQALLLQHEMASHDKESSFLCRNCGQSFAKADDMKCHSCGGNAGSKETEEIVKCDPKTREDDDVSSIQLDTLIDQSFLDWPTGGSSNQGGLIRLQELRKEQISGEMVIYIRTEGQEEPTAVRIKYDTNYGGDTVEDVTRIHDDVNNDEINHLPEITFPIEDSGHVDNDEGNSQFSLLSMGSSCKSVLGEEEEDHRNESDNVMVSKEALDYAAAAEAAMDAKSAEELVDSFLEKEPLKIDIKPDSIITNEVPVDVNKEKKTFTCKECQRVFKKKSNYTQHLGLHFVDLKKYRCEQCECSYAWKSSLNKHLQTAHGLNQDSKLSCTLCPKQLLNATQMQEHLKRDHYKERPHSCTECQKSFYKKADLAVHLRTHSKEKPYMCGSCGKSFSHLSHIIRHERIHSGIKPYTCDVCGRSFIQSTTLNIHRRRHFEPKKIRSKAKKSKSTSISVKAQVSDSEFILTEGNASSTVDLHLLELCKL